MRYIDDSSVFLFPSLPNHDSWITKEKIHFPCALYIFCLLLQMNEKQTKKGYVVYLTYLLTRGNFKKFSSEKWRLKLLKFIRWRRWRNITYWKEQIRLILDKAVFSCILAVTFFCTKLSSQTFVCMYIFKNLLSVILFLLITI